MTFHKENKHITIILMMIVLIAINLYGSNSKQSLYSIIITLFIALFHSCTISTLPQGIIMLAFICSHLGRNEDLCTLSYYKLCLTSTH